MANAQAGRNLDILELARLTVPIRINQGGHGSTDAKQGLTNLIVNADGVPFKDTNYSGTLKQDTLTADRTWTLPDASGTLALTSLLPASAVCWFAMDTAPDGWLECDGSAVSRTTYATLFAAIGTTFGDGDGSTTFNLPDLRGEFVRGYDHGKGTDSGRSFGSTQTTATQSHAHKLPNGFDSNSAYLWADANGNPIFGSEVESGASGAIQSVTLISGTTVRIGYSSTQINATGESRPPNVALLPCIKT